MFQKPPTSFEEEKKTVHDEVETVVGPSVNVEGDFSSEGNIIVKGSVSGSVKTSKVLTVEKGAKILANVNAGSAVISGNIKGNVRINDRLELNETAQIAGDITCKILSVAPGALLRGKITMKGFDIVASTKENKSSLNNKNKIKPAVKTVND